MARNCLKKVKNKVIKNIKYPGLEEDSGNKSFQGKSPA